MITLTLAIGCFSLYRLRGNRIASEHLKIPRSYNIVSELRITETASRPVCIAQPVANVIHREAQEQSLRNR
jgi:hypothetical protein